MWFNEVWGMNFHSRFLLHLLLNKWTFGFPVKEIFFCHCISKDDEKTHSSSPKIYEQFGNLRNIKRLKKKMKKRRRKKCHSILWSIYIYVLCCSWMNSENVLLTRFQLRANFRFTNFSFLCSQGTLFHTQLWFFLTFFYFFSSLFRFLFLLSSEHWLLAQIRFFVFGFFFWIFLFHSLSNSICSKHGKIHNR